MILISGALYCRQVIFIKIFSFRILIQKNFLEVCAIFRRHYSKLKQSYMLEIPDFHLSANLVRLSHLYR